MRCLKCGQEAPLGSKYCGFCGSALKTGGFLAPILVMGVLLTIGLLCYFCIPL